MLVLPRSVLDPILSHCRAEAPHEACGILAGRDEGALRRMMRAFPCRNASAVPELEYAVHPEDQLRVLLHVEDELRLEMLGVYHSHPQGPPVPSAVDAERANLPGASYVLVWLAPREGWGSWRWDGERFVGEGTRTA